MKKSFIFLVLSITVMAGAAFAAETVRIGLLAPMSGSTAHEGQDMQKVMILLVEEANRQGGILGRPIELIVEDEALGVKVNDPSGEANAAAAAARRLVQQHPAAVIGAYESVTTDAVQTIFQEAKILQITPSGKMNSLTEKGIRTFFRTCPRNDLQAQALAATASKMDMRRVAILHQRALSADALAEETVMALQMQGLEIAARESFAMGKTDYGQTLEKIRAASPDMIFFIGNYQDAIPFLRQKKVSGWKIPVFCSERTFQAELITPVQKGEIDTFFFFSPLLPQGLTTNAAHVFFQTYAARYGRQPDDIHALTAGDALNTILAAMKKTRSLDGNILASYLRIGFQEPDGLTGPIIFDYKGDRIGELFQLYRVDPDGTLTLQKYY